MITACLHKDLVTASGKGELSLDLTLKAGSVTCLYGDSGVGKTMILRMLAGLEVPDEGSIKYDDEQWFDRDGGNSLSVDKRKVGFVFQDYGLFPNMTVEENIEFACRGGSTSLISYYIGAFGLESLKNRKPPELSGGQKQRTAIARALVFNPTVLLLDEPFTAQDRKMSEIVGKEILKFTEEQQSVTVLVTHDIGAVFRLSTYIYSIGKGGILKEGTLDEVFLGDSGNRKNGLFGIVAEKVNRNGQENYVILVNEQLLEIQDNENERLEVGDEVFLKLNEESKRFQLQKL